MPPASPDASFKAGGGKILLLVPSSLDGDETLETVEKDKGHACDDLHKILEEMHIKENRDCHTAIATELS